MFRARRINYLLTMLISGAIIGMFIYQFAISGGGFTMFFLQFKLFGTIGQMFSAGIVPGLMFLMIPLLSLTSMAVFVFALLGMILGRSRGYAFIYNFFAFIFFLAAGLYIGMNIYMMISTKALVAVFDWVLLGLCFLGILFCWASLKKNAPKKDRRSRAVN